MPQSRSQLSTKPMATSGSGVIRATRGRLATEKIDPVQLAFSQELRRLEQDLIYLFWLLFITHYLSPTYLTLNRSYH